MKSCAMIIHHYLGLILYSEYKHRLMTRFGSIQDKNGAQFLALKMSDFLDTLDRLSRKLVVDNVSNFNFIKQIENFCNCK